MSLQAMLWALKYAPATDPTQVLVLVALAERANDDGTVAWPAQTKIAERARVSERTVRRVLNTLEVDGLIRRGDQRYVAHLPADRRPVVWDLAVERVRTVESDRGDSLTPRSGRPRAPHRPQVVTTSPDAGGPDTGAAPGGHRRPAPADRPDIHDRSSTTERGDTGDTNEGTPVADNTSLDTSLKGGCAGAREVPGSPPPARCSQHAHLELAPACAACRDARHRYEDWRRDRATRSAAMPIAPRCPRHPKESAAGCRRCAGEATPPPPNWRELIGVSA